MSSDLEVFLMKENRTIIQPCGVPDDAMVPFVALMYLPPSLTQPTQQPPMPKPPKPAQP